MEYKTTNFVLVIILNLLFVNIYAQKESLIWHTGFNTSVDFSSGFPKPHIDTPNNTGWGSACATICDSSGTLLFYSYGKNIINRNHVVMLNSDSLMGAQWSKQSVIIIPYPNKSNNYLEFTIGGLTTETGNIPKGLHYNVVDMELDNGLGGVKFGQKNVKIIDEAYCNLTFTKHYDGKNYWVFTYNGFDQKYYAFKVDSSGVNPQPVISNGKQHPYDSIFFYVGRLKISHNGKYIANIGCTPFSTLIHKFDNQSGEVDTTITLRYSENISGSAVNLEFSPSNKLANLSYETRFSSFIYQFDLNYNDLNDSKIIVAESILKNGYGFADVQLGPDRKIYITNIVSNYISTIKFPDLKGVDCGFVLRAIEFDSITYAPFNEKGSLPGCAPQILPFPFEADFLLNYTCLNDSTEFHIQASNYDSVIWNFGDFFSGVNNVSHESNPTHTFSQQGNYLVDLLVFTNGLCDTIKKSISIKDINFSLGNSPIVFCSDTSVLLKVNIEGCDYLWQDGSTRPYYSVTESGVYSVDVSNQYCSVSDEVELIKLYPPDELNLGNDTTICNDASFLLKILGENMIYTWQDGSNSKQFLIDTSGEYYVTVSNNCGSVSDTIYIYQEDYNCKPHFANAFTPNNDGLNDIFSPISECNFDMYNLKIFNRWGVVLFETSTINEGWDGTYQNQIVTEGAYI